MKDLLEVRFTVAGAKIEGRTVKAIAKVVGKTANKLEPQLLRIAEALTKYVEDDVKVEENK